MRIVYKSDNGYHYEIKEKKTTRIKKNDYDKKKGDNFPVKKGDKVKIIIKPYKRGITEIGIVKNVLTKKKFHSRGHKVRLESGTIGRLVKKL